MSEVTSLRPDEVSAAGSVLSQSHADYPRSRTPSRTLRRARERYGRSSPEEVLAVVREFLRELEPRTPATQRRYIAMAAGRDGWPSVAVFRHFGGFTKMIVGVRGISSSV